MLCYAYYDLAKQFYHLPVTTGWSERDNNSQVFNTQLINDLYFYNLEEIESEKISPYFKSLQEAGVEYLSQKVTNLYMCPNHSSDIATISTLLAIQSSLRDAPLLLSVETGSEDFKLRELQELEENILSATVLSEAEVQTYLSAANSLLKKHAELGLSKIIGEDTVLKLERLIQMDLQKTPNFEEILISVAVTNESLSYIIGTGNNIGIHNLIYLPQLSNNHFIDL